MGKPLSDKYTSHIFQPWVHKTNPQKNNYKNVLIYTLHPYIYNHAPLMVMPDK